jgi:hypothetical protein
MFGVALTNGNYVVARPFWNNGAIVDAGAATWGNGTTGTVGTVAAANSLVGPTTLDFVGQMGVTALTNGNYVVSSPACNNGGTTDAGAVTWGSGASGVSGAVSAANSLVGSNANDGVGTVVALANGHYVVASTSWNNGATADAGAVTWCNGTTGKTGPVTAANSLIGGAAFDYVGDRPPLALTNGNYVVRSSQWDNGAAPDAGAATWCSGTATTSAVVSPANSLVGSANSDNIGDQAVALTNGNYVVASGNWDAGAVENAGAATWCSGAGPTSAVVSAANSIVGSSPFDFLDGLRALSDGNYVVYSSRWDNVPQNLFDSGAATWGNGTGGSTGEVSDGTSLVGNTDQTGLTSIVDEPVNDHFIAGFPQENGGRVRIGTGTSLLGVDGPRGIPGIRLLAPAPNPSRDGARIAAVFPARDRISIALVDVRGRTVRTLAKDQPVEAGDWSIRWDGLDQAGKRVPSGIYFVRLKSQATEVTGRLSIVR